MSGQIIVGVDVGTAKVVVAVGELHSDGSVAILGVGQQPSYGMRKGEVTDVEAAAGSIHAAVEQAERCAGVEIREVFVGVTGGHIRSFNNRGMHPVMSEDGTVTQEDVEAAVRNAMAMSLPRDHVTLARIKQLFCLDGQAGVENPLGMQASLIEVEMHVIHGVRTRLQNTVKAVCSVPLAVKNVTFNPLAAGLAVLTPLQKELGVLLIDMGAGTTDYVAYVGGTVRHSGVLAVGGDHVTNDISLGLKVPTNRAERLKQEYGAVLLGESERGQTIVLKQEAGFSERVMSRDVLCRIIEMRLDETLGLVKAELEQKQLLDKLGAGVFLTGGVARTRGLQQMAERIFGTTVTVGAPGTVSGVRTVLESPELSTAVGLVRYGALCNASKPKRAGLFGQLISRIGTWVRPAEGHSYDYGTQQTGGR